MAVKFWTFLLGCLALNLCMVTCQNDCPDGWIPYNNKCWYFSHSKPQLSWYAAESWCQQNDGHLASFATVEERDWVVNDILKQWEDPRWWIGLNDNREEKNFEWSDGTPYDPAVSNWKPFEPNNAYLENCVEVWIERLINDKQWNDRTCEGHNNYICKRNPGTFSSCPDNFQLINNRCYYKSSTNLQWLEASKSCKVLGAELVTIGSSSEQTNVVSVLQSSTTNHWTGLSDTASPGNLQWVDGSSSSYDNWGANQPPSPLPYFGSTCVEMDYGLGYSWSTSRCGEEKPFICERGLKGDCPPDWLYNRKSGKCYEFVVTENRLHTWTTAKKICSEIGAGMLKIESEDENVFIGSALRLYQNQGHPLVYIGASDVGHDNRLTWWDQTTVSNEHWAYQMPKYVQDRDDCVALYTGAGNDNWETVTCYEERPYVCEIPEGKSLALQPIDPVDGKCEEGWRHFQNKCYFFGTAELMQSSAQNYCQGSGADLTSILNSDEQSFIIGHLQAASWIGLNVNGQSHTWVNGDLYDFDNWYPGQPDNDGNCARVDYPTGEWQDTSCNNGLYFICKKDEIPTDTITVAPPTFIPDYEKCGGNGWISNPASDRCYKVNFDRRTWQDAKYACQQAGGELAAINSPEENEYVLKLFVNNPSHQFVWLGGNDLNNYNAEFTEHGWVWSDASAFNYIHWASGEPNSDGREDCMDMDTDGYWYDIDCFYVQASICEKRGNVDSIIGADPSDENCDSTSACCFKHIGAEYGGTLPDSVMSASSERDQWFVASRGRLNTPADVIIFDYENAIYIGTGFGSWSPLYDDVNQWLQVDFLRASEIKGIITQGRSGVLQAQERQWVKSYKVSYSQDINTGKWEFISDSDGQPIIFTGNADQDTQVTNLFPRPVIARYMRCHPVTWQVTPCLRVEYIGCRASCLHKLGMSSGIISDNMISASSSKNGKEPKQARAPVDPNECLPSSADQGGNYRGWISRTKSGLTCQAWSSQSPWPHDYTPENYPKADLRSNRCRNPDPNDSSRNKPWCFTTDSSVQWEECDVPVCPDFTPTGWAPSVVSPSQYVQVKFADYFKVSGVTVYKPTSANSYVTSYQLTFSDTGSNFISYLDPTGNPHIFTGLDATVTEYTDILREPISTIYVRILPQSYAGEPLLQFELHGCYADSRATCSDSSKVWKNEQSSFTVSCPSGCVEDAAKGNVYGTDLYTSESAICPAAIHAGKLINKMGGSITVKMREGAGSYTGSYRNFIQSQDYGHADGSFVFDGNTLRCADGWVPWQNHCYYVSMKKEKRTWHNARSDCLSKGGDLASILSNGENSFIEGVIYQAGVGGDVWIGLNDLDTTDYYKWSDGSPVVITKWFWDEPKAGKHRCVNIYRFEAYWNDKDCDETLAYICKKEKELLPPSDEQNPIDEGCEEGWKAFGSSCYQVSNDLEIYNYATILCAEKGAHQVVINDDYEQAFVHSLTISTITPGLDYTSYIGMTSTTTESGSLEFQWDDGEYISYTHWDANEPEVRFSCAFPFQYDGRTFTECTTYKHPARRQDQPWCSIDPEFSGRWINCGVGSQFGCTFMNDQTGFWQVDLCSNRRHYVCEKDRSGFTQPQTTTPGTVGRCASGWYGDDQTTACYQINEKSEDKRGERLSWDDALEHCRAQGADLVSIHSYEEEQKIIGYVMTEGVYSYVYFWMGLIAADSDAGYTWSDGSAVSYTNWNFGEPNNHEGKELCVEGGLTYSGYWNDLNCDAVRNWVCKIKKGVTPHPPPTRPPPEGEVSTRCGQDGTWYLYTTDYGVEKCYLFEDSVHFGWNFAQRNCSARGGNLVGIHSAEENSFLLSRSSLTSSNTMWIGFKDMGSIDGRSFQWADGTTPNYFNWAPGEPNNHQDQEDCAEIQTDGGLWNDDNCGTLYGFICEKFIGASSIEPPATPTVTGGCPTDFKPFGNKCYWFSGTSKNYAWADTIELCSNISALPATIQNEYEQAFVTSQLKTIGKNTWIGLSAKPSMEYVWFDQSELSYTNWDEFEPNGGYDTNACVHLLSTSSKAGKWADEYCYDTFSAACYTMKSTQYPEVPDSTSDCPTGYFSYADACYKVMDSKMTRSKAQESCLNEGANTFLMNIEDVYENNLFKSWFWKDITSDESIWTGMTFTTLDISGGRSTVFEWDNARPVEYTNWALNQPDTDVISSDSGCVRMDRKGNWIVETQQQCDTMTLPFICKQSLYPMPPTADPGEGTCDPGFIMVGDSCYYIEKGQLLEKYRSWHEAVHDCELRGATLASFHSEDECIAIINAIDRSSHNLFIGLSSDGFTGWKWVDGSSVDFFNWVVPGEPNGDGKGEYCVEMYPWSGKWNDISCLEGRGYICKKGKELFSCSSVQPVDRLECGYLGMEESLCLRRSCCWDPLYRNDNFSGCYYSYGVGPSGIPVTDEPIGSSGLDTGAIIGIIIGVLAVLGIIGGVVYCVKTDKTKDLSVPSFGGWSTKSSSSGKAPAPATVSGGFDNPISTMDTGETV